MTLTNRRELLFQNIVASPYLDEATRRIQSVFSESEADAIFAYGIANAFIVPFVNNRPIEYGTLIAMGEKPLGVVYNRSGNAWVNTIYEASDIQDIDIDLFPYEESADIPLFGGDRGYSALFQSFASIHFRTHQGKRYRYDNFSYGNLLRVIATQSKITVDGNEGYLWNQSSDSAQGTISLFWGARTYNPNLRFKGGISRCYINEGIYKLFPIYRAGDAGFYELYTGEFFPNVGTESFNFDVPA